MRMLMRGSDASGARRGESLVDLDDAAILEAYPWPADRTWVRANMVVSIDGRTQGPEGLSKSLSTPPDSRVFGLLRARADAVLVGAATIRAEQYRPSRARPAFVEERREAGQRAAPVVAIVTRRVDLDLDLPLFRESATPPIIITGSTAPPDAVARARELVEVIVCGDDSVDLPRAIDLLADRGLPRILCEGGADLLGGLLDAGLVDELDITVSPMLAGGTGPGAVSGLPPRLEQATLAHVLEQDGTLLTRYLLSR